MKFNIEHAKWRYTHTAKDMERERENWNSIWIQSANLKNNFFFSFNTNGEGAKHGQECAYLKEGQRAKGRKERKK